MTYLTPDWLNKESLSKALGGSKHILDFSIDPAVPKGENFLGSISRVKIKYRDDGPDKTIYYTNIILKTFPSDHMKSFIQENGLLTKEIKMYLSVLPVMSDILQRNIAPKYFESSKKDILMVEDLSLENFKNCSRIEMLDYKHCVAAITLLADFHGASFILKNNHPELIEHVKREVQFTEENQLEKSLIAKSFDIVSDEVKTWANCEHFSAKLFNAKGPIWDQTVKEVVPKETEFMVLVHGDYWTNNILFQYDNDQIKDVKVIDFQFCRWSTPAVDLQYFFATSVRNKEWIPSIIEVYLSRLNTHTQPYVITKDQLLCALCRTECLGLLTTISILPMMIADPSVALNLIHLPENEIVEGVNNNPYMRAASKCALYKKILPERLKYYERIGLLK